MSRRDLQNRELDATVECHAFLGIVGGDRSTLAKALGSQSRRLDTAQQQELEDGARSTLREIEVVGIVGTEVAVTFDQDLQPLGMRLDVVGDLLEHPG